MFSSLRTRFGIPGVISVIALVFAMLGGAYAANNSGDGNATASAKAKKGPRGPKGATGPAGPAGPAGLAGPKGDAGAAGQNGSDGADGNDGQNGKSVETGNATVGECPDGGATVQVAGEAATKKKICNGADGEDGETGFTATLPPGETQTGAWAFGKGGTAAAVPVSFAIPLAAALAGSEVHFINEADEEVVADFALEELVKPPAPAACSGDAAVPTAAPGHLCVYAGKLSAGLAFYGSNLIYPPDEASELSETGGGAGVSGARVLFSGTANTSGWGGWAVTGCGTGFPCP